MRILYFSRNYSPHDHRFLSALAQTGHQLYCLHLERRGAQLEDRALPPGVELVTWAGGQAPARLNAGPRLLTSLGGVLRKIKPDLVQAGPLQTAALLAALAGARPLVSMSWGYDLLIDAARGGRWAWATRYALRHSAALVGDCATIRERAIQYGMEAQRIVTFPWGVDVRHFTPGEGRGASEDESPFTVLSTRGWEAIYGAEVIARAFVQAAQALRAEGGPELRLMMLSGGSLASQLHQIFARGGVEEQVSYPGQIGFAELPNYYRRADLYVSASHSDGSSISLLEALACGCPALVSDIPGNREWVTPEVHGWWFPDGDANALTQGLLQAVHQRARLAEMGRRARTLAEERADWEKNFPKLFDAYALAQRG
jgi:glycosyltransferase involved in cell wall biosynthesis